MEKGRMLLTGLAALGIFSLGYLAGQSGKAAPTSDTTSSSAASHPSAHKNNPASPYSPTTKSHPRNANTDSTPNPEKGFSRRIVAMMSSGELAVNDVAINGVNLMPGEKVKEFLDLTDEQLETMKQIGRDRLQAKQAHEESITKVLKRSDNEIVFDVAADSEFAKSEKEAFIEQIRKEFGPDVAAVLQTSIGQAYGEFEYPRHVRYTVEPSNISMPENAPPEIRRMIEGQRNVKMSVNQNEDGSWMTDDQGHMIPGGQSSSGSININDPTPDAWYPRYHYLLERENLR